MILTRPTTQTYDQLAEKQQIKELIEFERLCRDNALWDEMSKCFAVDSRINISWFQGTGEEFVQSSKKMASRAPHKIHSVAIWLNSDKAVAVMVTTIQKRIVINGHLMELASDAKLIFRVIKVDGLWYISGLDSIYEQDSLIPVYPNSDVNLDLADIAKYRESYACLSYVLSEEGHVINSGLAGIDRPDLVQKLYNELDEWLYS